MLITVDAVLDDEDGPKVVKRLKLAVLSLIERAQAGFLIACKKRISGNKVVTFDGALFFFLREGIRVRTLVKRKFLLKRLAP